MEDIIAQISCVNNMPSIYRPSALERAVSYNAAQNSLHALTLKEMETYVEMAARIYNIKLH